MRWEILRNLSFARAHPPRSERTEPRLLPGDAPLPFRRPGEQNLGNVSTIRTEGFSGTPGNESRPSTAPVLFVADQRPIPIVRHSAGPWRELALAVCVVLGVGAVAGAGLLLSMPASTESPGTAAHDTAAPSPPNLPAVMAPPGAPATAAIPEAHVKQAAAADHTAAPPPAGPAPKPPAPAHLQSPSGNASSAPAPAESAPAAKAPKTAIAATDVSATPTVRPRWAPADHPLLPPSEIRRPAHQRPAVRHVRIEAARETRPPEPKPHGAQSSSRPSPSRPPERPIRSAQPAAMPQGDQAASFDRLMNQLTGPARPADQPLSPPAADAPDPFAQHASDK